MDVPGHQRGAQQRPHHQGQHDRETTQRSAAGEPRGKGITCAYYAMTADRFDDRSGDSYRLCFRDGRLMSKEALAP
ncbi:hypothetical protein EAO76_20680 [Streptomyces sp. sk2.1]|nr:hypothetical protein EAO76_20680 [Streptomyces sp. sk2.1]